MARVTEYNLENSSEGKPKTRSYITVLNKLRLIEAFFDDSAKEHIRQTQEILCRAQLDARNSIHKITDYFQLVCDLCNNENFVAHIPAIPNLHNELREARVIKKDNYEFTRDKVKEEFNNMKFMLHDVVKNYELSGNGGGQRNEEDDDWGSCGLVGTEIVDGDDRSNFLTLGGKKPEMERHWYLLYYWHHFEEES